MYLRVRGSISLTDNVCLIRPEDQLLVLLASSCVLAGLPLTLDPQVHRPVVRWLD